MMAGIFKRKEALALLLYYFIIVVYYDYYYLLINLFIYYFCCWGWGVWALTNKLWGRTGVNLGDVICRTSSTQACG